MKTSNSCIRKNLLIVFLKLILLLHASSLVQAQPVENDKKVAAGMLISAAMESIGYKAQNQVLTQLEDTFEEVGGLIYLGVIFSVILTAGLMGSYAPVLWLLIGPPMFIYLSGVDIGGVNNRLSSSGPDWKFGPFKDSANLKQQAMRTDDSPSEVAYFFHKYNEIISELYQELINKITSEDVRVPLLFMTKQRIMEELFAMDMRDGSALELSAIFLKQCSTEMNYARTVAAGRRDPELRKQPEYTTAKNEYCRLYPVPNKKITSIHMEDTLTTLDPPHQRGEPVSCAKIWVWLRQLTVKDVASQTETVLSGAFGPEARTAVIGINALINETIDGVADKITSVRPDDQNVEDDCPAGSGDSQIKGITSQGNSFETLAQIMSGMLIKKQQVSGRGQTHFQKILGSDAAGIVQTENNIAGGTKVNVGGSEAQLKRIKANEYSTARKYETFNFLMLAPYFQGALLYVLSILYPFFALMVLVPGKANAFFTWMALWAWVKSWDVGWAIVMVTDKILWEIMPHATYYDMRESGNFTPVNLMEMNFSGDFTYSISLYWTIVSVLITSVPIITAEVILGAKKGLSSAFLGGLSDISTRLSGAAESFVSTQSIGRQQNAAMQTMILSTQGALAGSASTGQDLKNNVSNDLGPGTFTKVANAGANNSTEGARISGSQEANKEEEKENKKNGE